MEPEKIERFENALLSFIERAVKERATPEEVAALPEVASVFAELIIH